VIKKESTTFGLVVAVERVTHANAADICVCLEIRTLAVSEKTAVKTGLIPAGASDVGII
jgi:hypothetical protein